MAKCKMHTGVKGRFRLTAVGPDGGDRRSTGWFDNLITNVGLRGIYAANGTNSVGCRRSCQVGSGNSTPSLLDTTLESRIATTNDNGPTETNTFRFYDSADPEGAYFRHDAEYQFNQGAAAGNVAEVGVGYRESTNSGQLFSRALVKDSEGNPTTITVLSDEFLVVEYSLYYYVNVGGMFEADVDGYSVRMSPNSIESGSWAPYTSNFNGTSTGYGTFYLSADSLDDPFLPGDAGPSGTEASPTSVSSVDYNDQDHTVIKRLYYAPDKGNEISQGIRVIRARGLFGGDLSGGSYVVEFTPALEKDNTKSLTIDFLMSWGNL